MKGRKLLYRMGLHLKRQAPTILTIVGAAGVIATAVMAVKATPKAMELLEQVTDEKGEDADSKILIEAAKDTYIFADGGSLRDPDNDQSDMVLFYDLYSRRYFNATTAAVIEAQYHLNRNFILRGGTTLNEFYDFLGLEKIDSGDDLGWGDEMFESGYMWIDFKNELVKMDDGMECYVISAYVDPFLPYAR